MAIRTQKEIRQRAPLWLIGLLILNVVLMGYDAKDEVTRQRLLRVWVQSAISPLQRATTGGGGFVVGFFQRIGGLWGAQAENEHLRERLIEMESELRDARATRDENERLRSLLDFKKDVTYGVVPGRVISRDPSVWFNSLIINRGTMHGVDLDMPVATPEGIVGRVVAVGPTTAQVMLITDERAAAGAAVGQLGSSNAIGSVRGFGRNGLLEMRYVSGLVPVATGDYVVTTGQDRIYPPGLNVGTVVEVTPGSATTPHVIRVRPGARLDSLQEVNVLQYRQPQQPQVMEKTLPNMDRGRNK